MSIIPANKHSLFVMRYPQPKEDIKTFEDLDKLLETNEITYEKLWNIADKIPIRNAVDQWLATKKKPETRRKYKFGIEKVFNGPLINFDDSISSLDADSASGVYEFILERGDIPKTMRQLCATTYAQFCDFVRTRTRGLIEPDLLPKEKKAYYKTAEIYHHINWKEFIEAIEHPFNLLGELVYLTALSSYRLRVSDSRQNVLNLSTDQICFLKKTIQFREDQSYHVIGITCTGYPEDFMNRLKTHINNRTGLVFTNQAGHVLVPKTIERAFKRASDKLNLSENITPVMLAWAGAIRCDRYWQEERKRENPNLII